MYIKNPKSFASYMKKYIKRFPTRTADLDPDKIPLDESVVSIKLKRVKATRAKLDVYIEFLEDMDAYNSSEDCSLGADFEQIEDQLLAFRDQFDLYEAKLNAVINCSKPLAVSQKFEDVVSADVFSAGVLCEDLMPADFVPADVVSADVVFADVVYADVFSADVVSADVVSADVVSADVVSAGVVSAGVVSADDVSADVVSTYVVSVDVNPAFVIVCIEDHSLDHKLKQFVSRHVKLIYYLIGNVYHNSDNTNNITYSATTHNDINMNVRLQVWDPGIRSKIRICNNN